MCVKLVINTNCTKMHGPQHIIHEDCGVLVSDAV